jgi:hypothetical protein
VRSFLLILLLALPVAAHTQSSGDAAAYNLLIQKVCVDAHDHTLPADPMTCPTHRRALRPGEPLPYHRYDQIHNQQHDSYPIVELDGTLAVNNPFNYEPFDEFNANGDGFDLYEVHDGWVSTGQTRDGGGFTTTFFGEGCKPYNGWVFFPASAIKSDGTVTAGSTYAPINSNYWEQNGQPFPGKCPPVFDRHSETSWSTLPGFAFGGIHGNPVRKLTTLRSVHGFVDSAGFRAHGHLEVFYFTQEYGTTRWEVWTLKSQLASNPQQQHETMVAQQWCNLPPEITYQGETFIVTACRDWSALDILPQPEEAATWPLPGQNLLRNFHFAEGWTNWTKSMTTMSLQNSNTPKDTHYVQKSLGGQGVRYVRIDCKTSGCGDAPVLTQDVPLANSGMAFGHAVDFAATVRTEEGQGTATLELAEIDANGTEIAHSKTTHQVGSSNGHFDGQQSVTLSATFVHGKSAIAVYPQVKTLRWTLKLTPGATYDLVDTWVIAAGK